MGMTLAEHGDEIIEHGNGIKRILECTSVRALKMNVYIHMHV